MERYTLLRIPIYGKTHCLLIGSMMDDDARLKKGLKDSEFLKQIRAGDLTTPNVFTVELGKLIKKAREEKGISQKQLAENLSRRQATISELENGKNEIGILLLVLLSLELNKPISYLIPDMTFFTSVNDIHNKSEEEALTLFRLIADCGDITLAINILKLLVEYSNKTQGTDYEGDGV